MKLKKKLLYISMVIFILLISISIYSRDFEFITLDAHKVSSFSNDRIIFQHVEQFTDYLKDNSYESLLIIKDRRMFFITDGYDSPYDRKVRKAKGEFNRYYTETVNDMVWANKINGRPDFIQAWDRRKLIMSNSNEEYISTNFGSFYKAIRDKFIKEHVDKFHQIMRNRIESDFIIERIPQSPPYSMEDASKFPEKFNTFVKAKSFDNVVYTCEDADGDGVTETFTVDAKDGFHWGYKSGPDTIFICKNTDKELETLIGKLCNDAVFGNVDDEKEMIQTFPKEKDIADLIKILTPMDPIQK